MGGKRSGGKRPRGKIPRGQKTWGQKTGGNRLGGGGGGKRPGGERPGGNRPGGKRPRTYPVLSFNQCPFNFKVQRFFLIMLHVVNQRSDLKRGMMSPIKVL